MYVGKISLARYTHRTMGFKWAITSQERDHGAIVDSSIKMLA